MSKLKSPLKVVRAEMDLSRSELASLVYNDRDAYADKAQLAQAIARCEAGILVPNSDPSIKYLFELLSKQGYKKLRDQQLDWINERKAKMEQG